jgi:hypothetical protein
VGRTVGVAVRSVGKGTVGDEVIVARGREPSLLPTRNAPMAVVTVSAAMAATTMPIAIRVCLLNQGSFSTSTQIRLAMFQAGASS